MAGVSNILLFLFLWLGGLRELDLPNWREDGLGRGRLSVSLVYAVQSKCKIPPTEVNVSSVLLPNGKRAWVCPNPMEKRWNTGNRVQVSHCPEPEELEEDFKCEEGNSEECTSLPDVAIGAITVNFSSLTDNSESLYAQYQACENESTLASGTPGYITQCLNGTWTPIPDICEEECLSPRYCSDLANANITNDGIYIVTPSGNPEDPPVQVWCDMSEEMSDSGWTTILNWMSSPSQQPNETEFVYGFGNVSDDDDFYFLGLKNLTDMMWTNVTPTEQIANPFVFQFVITTENGDYHATYDEVLIQPTAPWQLLSVGIYHGNAGNAFVSSVNESFNGTWWTFPQDKNGSSVMSAAVTWGPLAGVGQIIGLEIKIRPLDYDHKLSCPPEIGVEPWWASTIVEMPISRSVNSTIHFTCKGELMKASLAVNQTIRIKSGNITCDNSSGSPSWANMTHLPCQLTCPANYNLSANGSFCYNFTQVESQNGILGASLICKKDNASLGLISSMADTSLAKLNTEYYTAHIVVNGTIRPPLPNNNSEQVLNNEQCITLIGSEGGDLAEWDFSSCYGRNSLKAFCTLPAYCPEGFTSYRGLCYIVVNNYSPLDSFPDALVSCHSEGAGLAYPESRDTLKFLVGLIKTSGIINGTYSTKDEVNVLIGLNDIDENWSLHGIYNPDEYIINAAGKSDKKKHYRYLSGPLADSKNMTLKHSLLFAEADIHGAVCQLYSMTECFDEPPSPKADMERDWSGSSLFNSSATYRCQPGYFIDEDMNDVTQEAVCYGQLGVWIVNTTMEERLESCRRVRVCSNEDLPQLPSSEMSMEEKSDSFYLDGTVTYDCPSKMSTAVDNFATQQIVTCSQTAYSEYTFLPREIQPCNVCLVPPDITNGTSDLQSNAVYTIGNTSIITCSQNHQVDFNDTYLTQCTAIGWSEIPPCQPVCPDPPPMPGANMSQGDFTENTVGSTVIYICSEGYLLMDAFPDELSSIEVTCESNHTWKAAYSLECAKYCVNDPISPPSPASTSWDGLSHIEGTAVVLSCPTGKVFQNLSQNITVKCEASGNWTYVSSSSLECYSITEILPELPANSVLSGPSPPYLNGTVVNITCTTGHLSPTGKNHTSFQFNGTSWIIEEQEFECLKACTSDPPNAGVGILRTYTGYGQWGAVASYDCGVLGLFPDGNATLYSRCLDGNWSLTDIPGCSL